MNNETNSMDLINDMFGGELLWDNNDNYNINKNETKEYYIGKAEYIINQLNIDSYFEFMKVFSKKFNELSINQQKIVKELFGIKDEIKIIYKENIVKKSNKKLKPKLNMNDNIYDR